MNDFERGFIVGMIEGEGTIDIVRNLSKKYVYYRPEIGIYNTKRELIEKCKEILKCGNINEDKRNNVPKHWSTVYYISIRRQKDILRILKEIEPHLISKKKQAEIVRRFILSRRDVDPNFRKVIFDKTSHKIVTCVHVPYTPEQLALVREIRRMNYSKRLKRPEILI
jgi:hypothetical protein